MRPSVPPPLPLSPRRTTHRRNLSSPNAPTFDQPPLTEELIPLKKRKERSNESFIIVRPPPSKTNHPLNLQVQLVLPSTKGKETTGSSYSSPADSGDDQASTSSGQWEAPTQTGYTSVSSFSSVGSSVLSPTSRRNIVPLYNLEAHNIMTNVIVDAGTDTKVAKFHKRDMEILGLVVLEPVEVWAGASSDFVSSRDAAVDSAVASSATSYSSDRQAGHANNTLAIPFSSELKRQLSAQGSTEKSHSQSGARKFFGKIFTRRSREASPNTAIRVSGSSFQSEGASRSSDHSYLSPYDNREQPQASSSLRTLGLSPVLESSSFPPQGKHPKAYTWVVQKWLKDTETRGRDGFVNMRLEWRRGKSKRRSDGQGREPPPLPSQSLEIEDESDPEDSETPWTCSLILGRHQGDSGDVRSPARGPGQPERSQETRVFVGSVSPAPHHPKVVAALKIPNPLPDVDLTNGYTQKRTTRPSSARPPDPGSPSILAAKHIKDIVTCTAIWLIVREGFGGVGVERRKGDGWKIRG